MYHFIIEFRDNRLLGHGTGIRLEELQQMVQSHLKTQIQKKETLLTNHFHCIAFTGITWSKRSSRLKSDQYDIQCGIGSQKDLNPLFESTYWSLIGIYEEDLDDDLKLPPAGLCDLIRRLSDHWIRKKEKSKLEKKTITTHGRFRFNQLTS